MNATVQNLFHTKANEFNTKFQNIGDVETLIIGGGIVGAGIFRDLALHGQKVLLVDKGDFCSETSSKSSKMLHGGIRYLENMEFHLVYEALHEKNLWAKICPHLVLESPFLIPVYKDSLRPLWMVRAGMMLYDFLSGYQNHSHSILSKKETMEQLPGIKKDGLKGSGQYYDCIVDDAKLGLEVIYDGLHEKKAQALNYIEVLEVVIPKTDRGKFQILLQDKITKVTRKISAKHLIVAVGPFTDIFMHKILPNEWKSCLVPNKGSHLWISRQHLPIKSPLVIQDNKGRIIFVIPQGDHVLVGTTETKVTPPFEQLTPDLWEIEYLLDLLNSYFPESKLGLQHVVGTFSGVRPLVIDDNTNDISKTAREHKIFSPHSRMSVVVGGKYTTFRKMAEEIASWSQHLFARPYDPSLTHQRLRQRSVVLPWQELQLNQESLKEIIQHEHIRTPSDVTSRRLGIQSSSLQEEIARQYF